MKNSKGQSPETGYYWYVPGDKEKYPELNESQPVKIEGEFMYICGSEKGYPLEECMEELVPAGPPIQFVEIPHYVLHLDEG